MAYYKANGEKITDPAKIAQLNKCRRTPVKGFNTLADFLADRDAAVQSIIDQPSNQYWKVPLPLCANFGLRTSQRAECVEGCPKGRSFVVFGCEVYGTCTQMAKCKDVPGTCRDDCPQYRAAV